MHNYPVIKQFIYNNNCYYYDYVTNYIYRVSDEQYKELKLLCRIGIDNYLKLNRVDDVYKDIKRLIVSNRINGCMVDEIRQLYSNNYTDICNRCMSKLQLQVTQGCNFSCRYCVYTRKSGIGRKHEYKNMSWKTAKSAVDFLFEHSTDTYEVFINFYGGEPFLNFDLIEKVVKYANEKFKIKQIYYTVITNGSVMNQHIIDFFDRKRFCFDHKL